MFPMTSIYIIDGDTWPEGVERISQTEISLRKRLTLKKVEMNFFIFFEMNFL